MLPSSELSSSLAFALEANKKMSRGEVHIRSDDGTLHIAINAPDLTALRAALNTHLRLLDMLLNTWEVVENGRSKRH